MELADFSELCFNLDAQSLLLEVEELLLDKLDEVDALLTSKIVLD